jgi:hypothetical protein
MTQLPGIIQSAPNQSLGFDADSVITKATAQKFASQGYKFCLRYLSLGAGEAPGDLTYEEALSIFLPLVGFLPPNWEQPTAIMRQIMQFQWVFPGK